MNDEPTVRQVWTVSEGEYSGYHVLAVFASEELAEAALPVGEESYESRFVEDFWLFERPAVLVAQSQTRFVQAWPRDGTVSEDTRWLSDKMIPEWELRRQEPCSIYVDRWDPTDTSAWLQLIVEGTDTKGVRKVFSEVRARLIALPFIMMTAEEITEALEAAASDL